MKSKIIACDIGTSRVKTAIVFEDGSIPCIESCRIERTENPDTQNASEWYDILCKLLRRLDAADADAVVLTGNMHALLGIDRNGNTVSDAVLWSSNIANDESDTLNKCYKDMLIKEFGNPSTSVFTLPKIMYMKKHNPELYNRSVAFLQSKDYIAYRLTGNFATDTSDASGTFGMSLDSCKWNTTFLDEIGIDQNKLPPILKSTEIAGRITRRASNETSLPEGMPVIIGCGDLASAAIGSGADLDTLSLTLGTAGQLLAPALPHENDSLKGKLFVFAHADPGKELFLGSVPAGGFSLEWFAKTHNITMDRFFEEASNAALSSSLPIFLPYILGRGAPYMDYRHVGAHFGLSASHGLAELCRSAVFGALAPLRQCADLMENFGNKRKNIVLQSLACREKSVRDTACALFRQKKFMPHGSEASIQGAAAIGFTALGVFENIDAASKILACSFPCADEYADGHVEAAKLYTRFLECAEEISDSIRNRA